MGVDMFAPVSPDPDPEDVERRMDSPTGPSMYVTRDCIERIGLMDEFFFLYWEEVDWAMRAKATCGIGYAHNSVVPHISGSTTGAARGSRETIGLFGLSGQPESTSLRSAASPAVVAMDPVRRLPQKRTISCRRIDAQFRRREQGSDRRPARRNRAPADCSDPGVALKRAARPPSIAPTLRLGDEKVAKRLHAGDVLHFLGIDEKALHFRHVRLRQQPHEAGIRLMQ